MYALRYTQMLEGCSEHMPISELAGGARIRHIFRDIFMKGVEQINPAKCVACLLLGKSLAWWHTCKVLHAESKAK